MTVYIIRHGEKEKGSHFNTKIKHCDPPLSKNGINQAESLVGFLNNKGIKRIYASEYIRAQQTAEPFSRKQSIDIVVDKRLNEIDNGITETIADEDIERIFPVFWNDYWSRSRDYRFPGGETGAEVKERQMSILKEIEDRNENTVLYSHEGFIRLLMCNILGMPVYHRYLFRYDFCGIMEIQNDDEKNGWKVRRFNQITY